MLQQPDTLGQNMTRAVASVSDLREGLSDTPMAITRTVEELIGCTKSLFPELVSI